MPDWVKENGTWRLASSLRYLFPLDASVGWTGLGVTGTRILVSERDNSNDVHIRFFDYAGDRVASEDITLANSQAIYGILWVGSTLWVGFRDGAIRRLGLDGTLGTGPDWPEATVQVNDLAYDGTYIWVVGRSGSTVVYQAMTTAGVLTGQRTALVLSAARVSAVYQDNRLWIMSDTGNIVRAYTVSGTTLTADASRNWNMREGLGAGNDDPRGMAPYRGHILALIEGPEVLVTYDTSGNLLT